MTKATLYSALDIGDILKDHGITQSEMARQLSINPDAILDPLKESKKVEDNKLVESFLKESFNPGYNADDAIEKFCILMDWEVTPEDVKSTCECDGKIGITLNDGQQFVYDAENDCLC